MSKSKTPNLRLNGKELCSVCLAEQADNLAGCPQCFGLVLEPGRWVQPLRGGKPKPDPAQKQSALFACAPEYPG